MELTLLKQEVRNTLLKCIMMEIMVGQIILKTLEFNEVIEMMLSFADTQLEETIDYNLLYNITISCNT